MKIYYLPIFLKKFKVYAKKNRNLKKDFEKFLQDLKNLSINSIYIKNNVYKVRLQNKSSNRGKSSGYRVYYFYKIDKAIVLLYIYSKQDLSNLDDKIIDKLIKECKILFKDEIFDN